MTFSCNQRREDMAWLGEGGKLGDAVVDEDGSQMLGSPSPAQMDHWAKGHQSSVGLGSRAFRAVSNLGASAQLFSTSSESKMPFNKTTPKDFYLKSCLPIKSYKSELIHVSCPFHLRGSGEHGQNHGTKVGWRVPDRWVSCSGSWWRKTHHFIWEF